MAQQAEAANEYQHRIGHDFHVSDALDPEYLDENCPLCSEPLNGEKFFHLECGKRENAADDRWERYGSREMHETLLGGFYE